MMRWTARISGVAICHIAVISDVSPMSAYGYKRTFWRLATMSALGGKADMPDASVLLPILSHGRKRPLDFG